MSELSEIVSEFEAHYWAPDGLVRLDKGDQRGAHSPLYPDTVSNENGILFLAEVMLEFKLKGVDLAPYEDRVRQTLDWLAIEATGCFTRKPAYQGHVNSHDNIVGIIILCQLFDFDDILSRMATWGRFHTFLLFYSYNDQDPKNIFNPSSWLQPRDQALLELAVYGRCSPLQELHLKVSIWTKSKHKRMMRLRMESVKMSYQGSHLCDWLTTWWGEWGGYKRFAKECAIYYKEGQPYRRLTSLSVL